MMETLTASTLNSFFENPRDKDRSFFCPALKDCVFSRQEIRVSRFRNNVYRGFPLSVSMPVRKTVRCINPAVSSSQITETSTGDEETRQTETVDTTQTKTVHVKFQLKRECSFGEQFFMVGDDPMFGLWDPSNAVPLNWSEEHVWKVELDMPCDKAIRYKFILKGVDGVILWQPGPDRVFQTWGTSKTISVSEDWENAELQTITEEDTLLHTVKDTLEESPAMIVTQNSPQPAGDLWDDDVDKKPNSSNDDHTNPTKIHLSDKPTAIIIAENITEQNGELRVDCHGFSREGIATDANNFENNVLSINGENLTLSNKEKDLDSGIGIPVLVPGLTPTSDEEEEEEEEEKPIEELELDKEIDSSASSLGSDKDEGFSVPEPSLEEENENAMAGNVKQELQGKGAVGGRIEEDLQWGRRTLQHFLTTLGLLKHSS